jgi:hypothetical protein
MSKGQIVYVKTRRRSVKSVRAAAEIVVARHSGWSLSPADGARGEDEIWIDGLGGPIDISQHGFGVALAISPARGVRDVVPLTELAKEIGTELGSVLDEPTAAALIEKEEAKPAAPAPETLASRVSIVLVGYDGEELYRGSSTHEQFRAQQTRDGLKPVLVDVLIPAVLSEEGRLPFRARRLKCTMHGADGAISASYEYDLDGYGRIIAFSGNR